MLCFEGVNVIIVEASGEKQFLKFLLESLILERGILFFLN